LFFPNKQFICHLLTRLFIFIIYLKYDEWFEMIEINRVRPVYTVTRRPRQTMQNCALRHRWVLQDDDDDDDDSVQEHRYFGTPRQLWYGSRLTSKELRKVVDGQIGHLVNAKNVPNGVVPYSLLIVNSSGKMT
jgi:hypothetical protein